MRGPHTHSDSSIDPTNPLAPLVDAQAAAEYFDVSPQTIYRLARAGVIIRHLIGGRAVRFRISELEAAFRQEADSPASGSAHMDSSSAGDRPNAPHKTRPPRQSKHRPSPRRREPPVVSMKDRHRGPPRRSGYGRRGGTSRDPSQT